MARKTTKRSYGRRNYYRKRAAKRSLYDIGKLPDEHALRQARRLIFGPNRYQRAAGMGTATGAQMRMRKALDYYGEGDYTRAGGLIGQGLGHAVGYTGQQLTSGLRSIPGAGSLIDAGAKVAENVGTSLGKGFGSKVQAFSGFGDYTPNQLIAGPGSNEPLSVNSLSKTGDVVVSQSEFIGNITARNETNSAIVTKFSQSLDAYDINPGISKLFPFLSQIANNYEMYEWQGLMVQYRPNSGEAGDSNQLGKIIIATNYDPDCSDFRTSVEMQNYDYSNSCKPSQMLVHGIETDSRQRATQMKYVRDGETLKDKILTDIGKLFVAHEGVPVGANSSVILGELHVTYSVRLSRAKLYQSLLGNGCKMDLFRFDGATSIAHTAIIADPKNSGNWTYDIDSSDENIFHFKLDHNIVAGYYEVKVTAHIDGNSPDGTERIIPYLGATSGDNTNLSFIKRHQSAAGTSAAAGDYFQSKGRVDGVSGYADNIVTMFYIKVDNVDDKVPTFRIVLDSWDDTDTPTSIRVTITQVSSKIEEIESTSL